MAVGIKKRIHQPANKMIQKTTRSCSSLDLTGHMNGNNFLIFEKMLDQADATGGGL